MDTVFWARLKALCKEKGTTPTGMCKEIGLSTGSPPTWKRGSIPIQAVREKIAEYFGVDPQYFVTEKEKSSETEASELSEDALMAARIIDRLPPDGRRLILAQMQAAERELLVQDAAQESP